MPGFGVGGPVKFSMKLINSRMYFQNQLRYSRERAFQTLPNICKDWQTFEKNSKSGTEVLPLHHAEDAIGTRAPSALRAATSSRMTTVSNSLSGPFLLCKLDHTRFKIRMYSRERALRSINFHSHLDNLVSYCNPTVRY